MARDRERSTRRERHEGTVTRKSTARIKGAEVAIREDEERIPVDDLQEIVNPARVRVTAGLTQAGPNQFEFVRVDVSVEMPCEPTEKAVKKCYLNCSNLVEDMIEKERKYAQERMD